MSMNVESLWCSSRGRRREAAGQSAAQKIKQVLRDSKHKTLKCTRISWRLTFWPFRTSYNGSKNSILSSPQNLRRFFRFPTCSSVGTWTTRWVLQMSSFQPWTTTCFSQLRICCHNNRKHNDSSGWAQHAVSAMRLLTTFEILLTVILANVKVSDVSWVCILYRA